MAVHRLSPSLPQRPRTIRPAETSPHQLSAAYPTTARIYAYIDLYSRQLARSLRSRRRLPLSRTVGGVLGTGPPFKVHGTSLIEMERRARVCCCQRPEIARDRSGVSGSCLFGSGQPNANHGHHDNCDSRNRPGLAAPIVVIQAFARRRARITAVSDSNSRAATASSWYQHHRARTDSDTAPASRGEGSPSSAQSRPW
jgi:hypothetical protein